MPTLKPGKKRSEQVWDEESEVYTTIKEWGDRRGLTFGKATKCILADWSDAMNGRPNPFALAIAAISGTAVTPSSPEQAMEVAAPRSKTPEELAQERLRLQAAEQFL